MELIQYELDNGMNVLLAPSAAAPVVACNVWVGVGSADETRAEAGLAHVHEHMLFKGTERRGVGQIAREVEAAGGHINAFTSLDQTCYYVVLSSRFLERGLDILSDAIAHSAFDADELGRELEVIQEELKRGEDSPSRMATLKLFETSFTEHTYRFPIIGTKESIDSFVREDVLHFFHKHYVPSNMTLVLAGDIFTDGVRALVAGTFGQMAPSERYHAVERPSEPEQTEFRAVVEEHSGPNVHLRVGMHIPPVTAGDLPALELLATIMGQGQASHLFQTIHRERQLVQSIYTAAYTLRDSGLFVVAADYQLEREDGALRAHEPIVEELMAEVFRFRDVQLTEAQVRRARTLQESQAIYGKQTIEGLAMKYGHFQMMTGDARFEDAYYERLSEVTVEDLRDVARRYLNPDRCTVILSAPKGQGDVSVEALEGAVRGAFERARQDLDGSVVTPAPAPEIPATMDVARDVEVDDDGFAVVQIPGGPKLVIQEDHTVEIFTVRALALGGLRYETPEHNGISSLAATMLDKGTPSHGAVQIAGEMESMASGYSGMSGRNTIGGALTGLSRYLVPTMERFAEALFHASVPEDEFERERIMHLRELKSRQDSLGAVNYDRFAAAFFHGHPYAMQSMGTPESVARIKADDVRAYLRRMIAPQQMSVAVVGDVHASEIVQMVEELFAVERAALKTSPSIGAPEARTGTTLVTGDLDKNQAHVIVGFDSPGIGSEDRYALDVLHAVLSGQGGRLFSELRDRQSLAYSVYASMLMGMEASSFTVNIGTSPEKIEQAVRGIFAQVQKLLLEPPTSEELAGAKQYLCGNHDIGLQRTSSRAMSFALNELYGVGWRSALEYSDRIQAVRVDDVTRLVEQYLDVEAAVVAVTKPAGVEVDAQLIEHVVGGRR